MIKQSIRRGDFDGSQRAAGRDGGEDYGLRSDEVLVDVIECHVGSVDWQSQAGRLCGGPSAVSSTLLGWEGAGCIVASGDAITRLTSRGDVFFYCDTPLPQDAANPQRIALPARRVAYMPSGLTYYQAARLPMAGTTAMKALFTGTPLARSAHILILGTGSITSRITIQLAKRLGARVTATANPVHAGSSVLAGVAGAELVIPHTCDWFAQLDVGSIPPVDLILDFSGGDLLAAAAAAMGPATRLVSVADPVQAQSLKSLGYNIEFVFVSPSASDLDELRDYVEHGELAVPSMQANNLEEVHYHE